MIDKIFVYGTLIIPAVLKAVTGKSFESSDAVLHGYARYMLKGRVYPGIIRSVNRSVEGCVYHGIDGYTLGLLDTFEGNEYRRISVTVTGIDGTVISAQTYAISPEHINLLTCREWDVDTFVKKYLRDYLKRLGLETRIKGFRG